jgi:ATP-dependent protease HslVU (ClpYQ) peptidase subunit
MSTIVVVRKGNKGIIASDSLFTQGSLKVPPSSKVNSHKIYKINDSYIGFTGWSAMSIIFEDVAKKYPKKLNFRSRADVFKTFLFLHAKLKEEYFLETKEKDDQPVESSQWDCLILSPSGIFSVQSYREVMECQKYWAEGSGLRLALGAMHATYDSYDDPEKIALAAIQAASEFDDATALPAQMYSLEMHSKKSNRKR